MSSQPLGYDDALAYLEAHHDREKSPNLAAGRVDGLSLDSMQALMSVLGDPHRSYPVVHVTGTNGKGSVAAMIEALLEEHGLVTGTYTSPHLTRVNERMRWTGEALLGVGTDGNVVARRKPARGGDIDDASLARIIAEIADAEVVAGVRASYFEVLTAAALSWFAQLPVAAAVVEVGLLGRFDATNVIDAAVSVITNIGHDHTDFTGDWRAKIAGEKSGIIKPGSAVVVGERDPDLVRLFEAATGADQPLWVAGRDFDVSNLSVAVRGQLVDLRLPGGTIEGVLVPVHGSHQAQNAAVAAASVEAFFGRDLDADVLRSAFERVVIPARFEVVGHAPLVIIDGAHNVEGADAAATTLAEEFSFDGRRILVVGMLAGRDPRPILDALDAQHADVVVATTAPSPRGVPAEELADLARQLGAAATAIADPTEAVETATALAGPDDAILVTGSLYVAGAVREALTGAPRG